MSASETNRSDAENPEIQHEEPSGVTRRSFLKSTAAGAVIAGGAGLLAKPVTMAESSSGTACVEPEGARPIAPIAPPSKWDHEADVVIVGTGGGGLAASPRLAEAGKSVIAIEKLQSPGGGSQEAGLFFTFGGSRQQNKIKFALPSFPFNPDALVEMGTPWYQFICKTKGQPSPGPKSKFGSWQLHCIRSPYSDMKRDDSNAPTSR